MKILQTYLHFVQISGTVYDYSQYTENIDYLIVWENMQHKSTDFCHTVTEYAEYIAKHSYDISNYPGTNAEMPDLG